MGLAAPLAAKMSVFPARAETPGNPRHLPLELKVNGQVHRVSLDARTTLLDALREHLGLTAAKKGCDHGRDNLADYRFPVNADIGEVEVILVPEEDNDVNPAGVKGLGELANVGTAAAVANAVFNATGIRVRELPIRLEKLL